jgi:hypothetical protein
VPSATSVKVTATILKKCDRSNHRPESNKACAASTCQHTCEPSAVKTCQHRWTIRYSANGRQVEKSYATLKLAQDAQLKLHTTKLEQGRTFIDPKLSDELFMPTAEAYISGLKIGEETRVRYLGILRNHVGKVFAGRTLAHMSTSAAADEVATLVNETMEHRAWQQRRVALMICREAMNAAQRAGKVASHKIVGIKLSEGTHITRRDARADDEGEGLGFVFLTDAQVSAVADGLTVTRTTKAGNTRTVALKGVGVAAILQRRMGLSSVQARCLATAHGFNATPFTGGVPTRHADYASSPLLAPRYPIGSASGLSRPMLARATLRSSRSARSASRRSPMAVSSSRRISKSAILPGLMRRTPARRCSQSSCAATSSRPWGARTTGRCLACCSKSACMLH